MVPRTSISFEFTLVACIDVSCRSAFAIPAAFNAVKASMERRMWGRLFPVSMIACNDLMAEPFDLILMLTQLALLLSLDDVLLIEYDVVAVLFSSCLSCGLGDVVGEDKGDDRASLLGIVDGTTDDVGFIFVCCGLNAEGGVAPTSPPPLILKKYLDCVRRDHDHVVGIDPASGRLPVVEGHAMNSRSVDFRNVHNPGPFVCMEYQSIVVLLAHCRLQCHLQCHLLLVLLSVQCFERSTFSYYSSSVVHL